MGGIAIEAMTFSAGLDFSQFMSTAHDKSSGYLSILQQPPTCGDSSLIDSDLVDPPPENYPESISDDDESDEDLDVEELERRMWRDRLRLKRLKDQQQNKNKELGDSTKQRQSQEQARRKKLSRAQDGIYTAGRPAAPRRGGDKFQGRRRMLQPLQKGGGGSF